MSKTFLGIDVSKSELVVALLKDDSVTFKNNFNNNYKGFKSLIKWLKEQKVIDIKVCMESTGSYSTSIADFLYEQGYEVYVINPICIKSFAKSKLSRTKTDEADAEIIAEYISNLDSIPYKPRSSQLREIRSLYRCIEDLKKQRNDTVN
jgi:transposase